jgi:hypothetical protein
MPFINSESLGAPGSSGGGMVRASVSEYAVRTRFLGLRPLGELSLELSMRVKLGVNNAIKR